MPDLLWASIEYLGFSSSEGGPVLVSLKPGVVSKVSLCKEEEEEVIKTPSVQSHTPNTVQSHTPNTPSRLTLQQLGLTERSRSTEEKHRDIRRDDKNEENNTDTIANTTANSMANSMANGQKDITLCSPPKTENELLQVYYKQQEEIRRLRELLGQRDTLTKKRVKDCRLMRLFGVSALSRVH
ncbi:Coronin-2A [Bagarius yarrelli]|uniref:Coronin-2A n=1 Tax=Bagarius yarrelli TaxID=175774 RepID=A0A556VV21_BAGYA|nr:Coronin-2A [Bagarius yarrelli]